LKKRGPKISKDDVKDHAETLGLRMNFREEDRPRRENQKILEQNAS